MARRIRMHAGLAPQERIAKPLFLLMSKSDIWGNLLRDEDGAPMDVVSPPFGREHAGLGKVSIRRVDRTSARLRELLMAFAPEVVTAAEDAFERVVYVPVSATGTSPVLDKSSGLLKMHVRDIVPAWCSVPFVYALARWSTHLMASDKSENGAAFYGEDGEPAPEVEPTDVGAPAQGGHAAAADEAQERAHGA